jgi:hypothetical protein
MSSIPEGPSEARDQYLLDLVARGEAIGTFVPLQLAANGHTATVYVNADALKTPEGVRFNVSANLLQQMADLLNARLLTPLLVEQMYAQRAVTLKPHPLGGTPDMSTTRKMEQHSRLIDDDIAALGGVADDQIINTVGKDWVVTNKLWKNGVPTGKAANMGWLFEGPGKGEATRLPGVKAIQGVGTWHNGRHVDYSQVAHLVLREAILDGQPVDLDVLYTTPEYAPLVSHEGPLFDVRQPTSGAATSTGGGGVQKGSGGGGVTVVDAPSLAAAPAGAGKWLLGLGAAAALISGAYVVRERRRGKRR